MGRLVDDLLQSRRTNAILGWALVAFVGVAAVTSFLRGDRLWAIFAVVVLGLAVLPAVAHHDATAMIPWEITVLMALPLLGRAFSTLPLTNQVATYLSVAAIALVIAVELQLFTSVRMNDAFAVLFVTVATLATAGIWAVVRWASDELRGTSYLDALGATEHAIERALMIEFVASAVAGIAAGLVFAYYVRRHVSPSARLQGVEAE
jgi:hypothetical protein